MLVTRNRSTKCISLSQPGYISSYPHVPFSKSTPHLILYPTCPTPTLLTYKIPKISHYICPSKNFMQIVWSLLFLSTRSRPDLSFLVNYLSIYMTRGRIILTSVTKSSNTFGNPVILLWISMVPMVFSFMLWLIHPMHHIVIANHIMVFLYIWMTILGHVFPCLKNLPYLLYLHLNILCVWMYGWSRRSFAMKKCTQWGEIRWPSANMGS